MNRRKILKYIPSTTLAIILSTMSLSSTIIFANDMQDKANLNTELNLINIGNMSYISQYIDENISSEDKIILSNIKNIHQFTTNDETINDIDRNSNEEHENAKQEAESEDEVISMNNEKLDQIPIIAANLVSNIDNSLLYEPYIIKEVEETKVGIIGIVSKENEIDMTSNVTIEDEIETINKYTDELVQQGIGNIIVLTDMKLLANELNDNTLDVIDIESNTYSVFKNIDSEVDIIISESELNEDIKSLNIQKENSDLLLIQTDENTIANINLSINKENDDIENKEVTFINNEDTISQKDEIIDSEGTTYEEENIEENDNLYDTENIDQDDNTQIQPYVVGGITNPNNQNPPPDNSQNDDSNEEDDNKKDDEDENNEDESDENSKNEEENDNDEEDNEDEEDDKPNENKSDNEEEEDEDEDSTNNPKTGDSSILLYIVGCIGAGIGLNINKVKRYKE